MRLPKNLIVTHTVDRTGRNMVQIESEIGRELEAYPDEIRALAAALCLAADESDQRSEAMRRLRPNVSATYPLSV